MFRCCKIKPILLCSNLFKLIARSYRGVDKLRRSAGWEARELVPRQRDVGEVLERAEEPVRQVGDEVVLHVELLERGAVGERAGNGVRL